MKEAFVFRFRAVWVVFGLMAFVVFFPTYLIGGGHVGQRILYVVYPALVSILALFKLTGNRLSIDTMVFVLCFAFLVYFLLSLSKLSFMDIKLMMAHFRYLAYLIVYWAGYNYIKNSDLTFSEFKNALLVLVFIVAIFVLLQFIDSPMMIATGITNRGALDHLGLRIGGPFVWSYALGFVVMPMLVFCLLKALMDASVRYGIGALSLLLLISAGQSKASYLSIMFNFFLLGCCSFSLVGARRALMVSSLLLLVLVAIISYVALNLDDFGNIARFVIALSEGRFDASTNNRLDQLGVVFIALDVNPWFGYPLHDQLIENAYGYYVYNFGIVGALMYLFVILFMVAKSWFICRCFLVGGASSDMLALSVSSVSFALSPLIFSLASSPIDGHKTAYFYWSYFFIYFALCSRSGVNGFFYKPRDTLIKSRKMA